MRANLLGDARETEAKRQAILAAEMKAAQDADRAMAKAKLLYAGDLTRVRDMARLAKDPTPGPAGATFNNQADLTRDTDKQLQMTLDAIWNGNLLVPWRSREEMGILSTHPLEVDQSAQPRPSRSCLIITMYSGLAESAVTSRAKRRRKP